MPLTADDHGCFCPIKLIVQGIRFSFQVIDMVWSIFWTSIILHAHIKWSFITLPPPQHQMFLTYLKFQNSSSLCEKCWCLLHHLLPRLFANQTSKPASASIKPKLLLGLLVIHIPQSVRIPGISNTAGFEAVNKKKERKKRRTKQQKSNYIKLPMEEKNQVHN